MNVLSYQNVSIIRTRCFTHINNIVANFLGVQQSRHFDDKLLKKSVFCLAMLQIKPAYTTGIYKNTLIFICLILNALNGLKYIRSKPCKGDSLRQIYY